MTCRVPPPVVDPGDSRLPAGVPSDATVLFDGTDLSNWTDGKGGEAKWKIVDAAMESVPQSGYVFTTEKFGDCQLHVEWASPSTVKGKSQGRGNSGIYLMGKYEVQVLDSYDNPTYADGSAASLYGQYPPLVNASRQPGEWQAYDIIFKRPRFDENGKLVSPATVTVLHNGVVVQNHSELFGPTNWIQHKPYQQHADALPLSLQDHGNPVRYRNIWIRSLEAERPQRETPYETEADIVTLTDEDKQRLVGEYGAYAVRQEDGTLFFIHQSQPLEMIPLSATKFSFRKSAGHVEFAKDDSGNIASLELRLDAAGLQKADKKQ